MHAPCDQSTHDRITPKRGMSRHEWTALNAEQAILEGRFLSAVLKIGRHSVLSFMHEILRALMAAPSPPGAAMRARFAGMRGGSVDARIWKRLDKTGHRNELIFSFCCPMIGGRYISSS